MRDETGIAPTQPDLRALVATLTATGERVAVQMAALRADLAAAEARTAVRVEEAEAKSARELEAENLARRRSQRRTWITGALGVCLSLVSLVLWHGQVQANRRTQDTNRQIQQLLAQNYVTAQQQLATRTELLCPLYGALLGVAANQAPTPLSPAQQKARDDAIAALRKGYTKAACLPALP
jgi:hypothetical protein